MQAIADISHLQVLISLSLFVIPIAAFSYYRVEMTRSLIIAVVRMIVQLAGIALYLDYIFTRNSILLNSIWVITMVGISSFTTATRSGLVLRTFLVPLLLASFFSIVVVCAIIFGAVLPTHAIFHAQYLIPICGMIIGNSMNHNIVGLSNYFEALTQRPSLYYFLLTNTGSSRTALQPYIKNALRASLNPLVANMAVIGLISLPGMMTGQILGGSPPSVAIKYQIVIMVSIFSGCTITLLASLYFTHRWLIDPMGRIKTDSISVQQGSKKPGAGN